MARSTEFAFSRERAHDWSEEEGEERWPVLHTVLFTAVACLGLWAVIIAGVRWLVG